MTSTTLRHPKLFLTFFQPKSHVKSTKHLTHCLSATSTWHFSLVHPAIIEIEIKKARPKTGTLVLNAGKPFAGTYLDVTPMVAHI
jgi:hypothetical protein